MSRVVGPGTAAVDPALHARRLAEVDVVLRRLDKAVTLQQLLDKSLKELTDHAGFSRASLFRRTGTTWLPWVDPVGATASYAVDAMSAREPVIVDDAEVGPYVVVPIVVGGDVVGVIAAGRGPDERPVDDIDRDVVWLVAQGVALVQERLALADQHRVRRARLEDAIDAVRRSVSAPFVLEWDGDAVFAARTLDRIPARVHRGAADGDRLSEELTGREHEVLELMATGATNAQIACDLVVSESTVKSHVRRILRKLRARNRAQAIACYLGTSR